MQKKYGRFFIDQQINPLRLGQEKILHYVQNDNIDSLHII